MKNLLLLLILMTLSVFADYKERLEVVDIPYKEATMLENSTNYNNVILQAREVTEEEITNFFNESLMDDGFVPVLITVTNNSESKVSIYGSLSSIKDVEKIDVQNLLAKYQVGRLKGLKTAINILTLGIQSVTPGGAAHEAENQGYDEAKKNNFNDKSLHSELLYPGDTISGFVYFDKNGFDKTKQIVIPIQFMDSVTREKVSVSIN